MTAPRAPRDPARGLVKVDLPYIEGFTLRYGPLKGQAIRFYHSNPRYMARRVRAAIRALRADTRARRGGSNRRRTDG